MWSGPRSRKLLKSRHEWAATEIIYSNKSTSARPRALGEPSQPVRTGLKPRCYDQKADRATDGGGVGSGQQPPKGGFVPVAQWL